VGIWIGARTGAPPLLLGAIGREALDADVDVDEVNGAWGDAPGVGRMETCSGACWGPPRVDPKISGSNTIVPAPREACECSPILVDEGVDWSHDDTVLLLFNCFILFIK
jgi:hypothetical protein